MAAYLDWKADSSMTVHMSDAVRYCQYKFVCDSVCNEFDPLV